MEAPQIQILDPTVAERVAAGEVIERPFSVIKELVENSIDAGATRIEVRLQGGGRDSIEVEDDGRGMSLADLELAPLRHATSKIRIFDDLLALSTLGFRGEALPSIAAVCELEITSRATGSERCHRMASGSTPREVTRGAFLGAQHGTLVAARGLFAALPARLKFLKSPGAEAQAAREWLERLALARPGIAFRLTSDDRVLANLRAADQAHRVAEILSREHESGETLAVGRFDSPAFRVRAFWVPGSSLPQARRLYQVINGRPTRDRLVLQAALSPFRQALLPGMFPALAIFIDCEPSEVDVNAHPSKVEVRFAAPSAAREAVSRAVDAAMGERRRPLAPVAREWTRAASGESGPETPRIAESRAGLAPSAGPSPTPWHQAQTPGQSWRAADSVGLPFERLASRYAGALFNAYLVFEEEGEVVLLDQHAAHERVRFEELRARGQTTESQQLLVPEVVRFDGAAPGAGELPARLARLGFEVELFDESALVFRSVPAGWGEGELRRRLANLVERVSLSAESGRADEAAFESLASQACHSSIRAGQALHSAEAIALLSRLLQSENPWNCPHGRPTVVRIPKSRFEEWFQRRV